MRSILMKLVVVFLLLIIVPVFVIGYIAINTASSSLISRTEASFATSTMQTSAYFDFLLNRVETTSMQCFTDSAVQNYADELYLPNVDMPLFNDKDLATKAIINLMVTDSNVINFEILLDNGEFIGPSRLSFEVEKAKNSKWYKKIIEKQGNPIWLNDHNEGFSYTKDAEYAVSFGRKFNSLSSGKQLGVLLMDIEYDTFSRPLSKIHLGKGDLSYLITSEGKVLSAKGSSEDSKISERPFIKKVFESLKKNGNGVFYINDNKTSYMVAYYKSNETNWTAVSIIPTSEITTAASLIQNKTILFGFIFAILAAALGFIFSLNLTRCMKKIMKAMEKAENGDLTVSLNIRRKDELGKLANSFDMMIDKIKKLILQSKEAANMVSDSSDGLTISSNHSSHISGEISNAVAEVASGSSEQAYEAEASVKNISQLANKINIAYEGTKSIGTASENVTNLTADGIKTVQFLHKMADESNNITSGVVLQIDELNHHVKNINKITDILKSIADQTNLLSLNAAIEAARAGDSGKGFAVVAGEIRKLAAKSDTFTKEIHGLIEKILIQTKNSTDLVRKAEKSIKEQSNMVKLTEEQFFNIRNSTVNLIENSTGISEVIIDMNKHKEQVMASVETMSSVSQQTAALAEEVSASTEVQLASTKEIEKTSGQLNILAQNLKTAIEKFKV